MIDIEDARKLLAQAEAHEADYRGALRIYDKALRQKEAELSTAQHTVGKMRILLREAQTLVAEIAGARALHPNDRKALCELLDAIRDELSATSSDNADQQAEVDSTEDALEELRHAVAQFLLSLRVDGIRVPVETAQAYHRLKELVPSSEEV